MKTAHCNVTRAMKIFVSCSVFVSFVSFVLNPTFGCGIFILFFVAFKMLQKNHMFIRNTNSVNLRVKPSSAASEAIQKNSPLSNEN